MPKKILVVWPSLPYPIVGAEQLERVNELKQFLRLGFEARIILKLPGRFSEEEVGEAERIAGVKMFPVRYKYSHRELSLGEKIKKILIKLSHPLFFDGAAMEYGEPEIKKVFEEQIISWRPDIAFFNYTYTWPLYALAKKHGVKVAVRSHNFEPRHFLEEKGRHPLNYFKFLPKFVSEIIVSKKSDLLFSISPNEEKIYRRLGAKKVINLPTRIMPPCLDFNHRPGDKKILEVFFWGSTYHVPHNCRAAKFVIKNIAPLALKKFPGRFKFHILGARFPEEFKKYLKNNIIYDGYVENLDDFLKNMDIALIPSLSGAGMQQKIFDPLSRGFPVVTSRRGLVGYPFLEGKEILLADSAEEFVSSLEKFLDYKTREEFSRAAKEKARQLFSWEKIDKIILEGFKSI